MPIFTIYFRNEIQYSRWVSCRFVLAHEMAFIYLKSFLKKNLKILRELYLIFEWRPVYQLTCNFISSTSTEDITQSSKSNICCGLPTINEGCCEDKESPVIDIEDMLSESIIKQVSKFKSYLETTNGNK